MLIVLCLFCALQMCAFWKKLDRQTFQNAPKLEDNI